MGMMWFWLILGIALAVVVWPIARAVAARRRRALLERRYASGEIDRVDYEREIAYLNK